MSAFGIFALILTTAYIIYFAVIIAKDIIVSRKIRDNNEAAEIFEMDFQQEESVSVVETAGDFAVGNVEIQTENVITETKNLSEEPKTNDITKKICSDLLDIEAEAIYEMGICPDIMEGYQAWLMQNGLIPNSISFYMRILRAVYNRAVEEDILENLNPFRHIYTGVDKTVKRAITLDMIKKIKTVDVANCPALDYARDMFLMRFLLRGKSLIDMCFLKKTGLKYGVLSYRRRKTGQLLTIAWTDEMQAILDKYPENPTEFLLPIISRPEASPWNIYHNIGHRINRNLKKVAKMAGIDVPVTLYVARHSWASAARVKGVPLNVISEGMGHDSETTTQIYLASLDSSAVDRANSLILKALK